MYLSCCTLHPNIYLSYDEKFVPSHCLHLLPSPSTPVSGIHTDDHFSYEFPCSTKFFKAVCFPHAEIVSDVRPGTSVLPHFLNALPFYSILTLKKSGAAVEVPGMPRTVTKTYQCLTCRRTKSSSGI